MGKSSLGEAGNECGAVVSTIMRIVPGAYGAVRVYRCILDAVAVVTGCRAVVGTAAATPANHVQVAVIGDCGVAGAGLNQSAAGGEAADSTKARAAGIELSKLHTATVVGCSCAIVTATATGTA